MLRTYKQLLAAALLQHKPTAEEQRHIHAPVVFGSSQVKQREDGEYVLSNSSSPMFFGFVRLIKNRKNKEDNKF
jgi:hypothetical protein